MAPSSSSSPSDSSSVVIDERRAHQLMERALGLAERGEVSSAILSCRQAISLMPNSVQSYSMLGLLLERSGDAAGAITAYEKVLELDPSSLLERESLGRLRATATQRRTLREDAYDAFEEERNEDLPTAPGLDTPAQSGQADTDDISKAVLEAEANRVATEAFATPVTPVMAGFDFAPIEETAAVSTTEVQAAAQAIIETAPPREQELPKTVAAVTAVAAAPVSSMPFPSTIPKSAPSVFDANTPLTLPQKEERLTTGQKLLRRPSFYFRSLPLGAAAAVSVLFLLWAHSSAPTRENVAFVPEPVPVNDLPPELQPEAPRVAQNQRPADTAPVNPTTNVPVAPPPASVASAPQTPAPATPNVASAPETSAPAPAPVPQTGNNVAVTPATAAPPAATAPVDSGRSSAGGTPVNTTGTGDRSYVQVAPGARSPMARPENSAATEEQAAGNDARSGRADTAIERMGRSIDSGGGDVAFRLQQRAQMYLQSGDSAKAVSDFQAAINAYEAMISRGDRVTIARSGIQACRRGMQIAASRR